MFDLSASSDLTIRINTQSGRDLLSQVRMAIAEQRGFAVATLNLDHIAKLRAQPRFRAAYARQSFVVADGNPIVWLSRIARQPVALTPGSELIDPLMALAAEHDAPVAFIGSTQRVLDGAAEKLEARHPGLRVIVRIAPAFGLDPEGEEIVEALKAVARSGARLCFLAFGAPKQEIIAARGLDLAPGCGFISVGAGLDFVVDAQQRAPVWVRRIAMEWLWRMLSDPRRLVHRYAACALLLPGLVMRAAGQRFSTGDPTSDRPVFTNAMARDALTPGSQRSAGGSQVRMAGAFHKPS